MQISFQRSTHRYIDNEIHNNNIIVVLLLHGYNQASIIYI